MDDRVTGVVSVAGFTPFRDDTESSGTGGLRRYSELYGWLPRLGAFVGQSKKTPVDFDEILASIAPKPTLVLAPKLDWHANPASLSRSVESARDAYKLIGDEHTLRVENDRPCQFDNTMQTNVIDG